MERMVFLNGEILPAADARISVVDLGFNYGAGVYEVVNLYGGSPYKLAEHLERFRASAKKISLPLPDLDYQALCREVSARNNEHDGIIYLQATFGSYGIRSHILPRELRPTIAILTQPAPAYSRALFLDGITIKSVPDLRWARCDIKSISLLANLMAVNEAVGAGYDEAAFVSPNDGTVSECGASNIFAVRHGTLVTPPKGSRVLSGITRETILSLASAHLPVEERFFPLSFLFTADEVFVSSTTKEIMPVRQIDGIALKRSARGVTQKLMLDLIADVEKETGIVHPKRAFLGENAGTDA